jgi:hypothetical protein
LQELELISRVQKVKFTQPKETLMLLRSMTVEEALAILDTALDRKRLIEESLSIRA